MPPSTLPPLLLSQVLLSRPRELNCHFDHVRRSLMHTSPRGLSLWRPSSVRAGTTRWMTRPLWACSWTRSPPLPVASTARHATSSCPWLSRLERATRKPSSRPHKGGMRRYGSGRVRKGWESCLEVDRVCVPVVCGASSELLACSLQVS